MLPRTAEYFYACASKWDGLQTSCKECQSSYSASWRAANPERHAENNARWQRENPDIANAKSRRWRLNHPDQFLAAVKRWQAEHPEERRLLKRKAGRNREARQRNVFVESVDDRVLFARDEGRCGICGLLVDPRDWAVDHIIPISHLGCGCGTHEEPTHSYANTRVAHPTCNSWKGGRLDSELPPIPDHILRVAEAASLSAATAA